MRKILAVLAFLLAPAAALAASMVPNPANVDSLPTSGLTQYGLVYGNTKQGMKSLTDIGSVHVLLHGNASGLPTWGPVDLSTETTGTLPPGSCTIAASATLGCVKSPGSPVVHMFLQTFDASGNPVTAQPACADISDAVSTCNSLASPTFTGTIGGVNETLSGTFTLTGGNPQARLDTAAGVNRSVAYRTGGLDRFQLRVNATAEGGSNAGSDFELRRYNDAGTFVDDPLSIIRATGVVTIADGLTLTVPLAISSGGTGASTAAAARSGLGVAIGSQVQAWNTYLDCLSNLPPSTGILKFGTVGACSAGAATFADLVGSLGCSQTPAQTGDVTSSAGSCATTVTKIQGVTVSGVTGTVNVAFSANPIFTGTVTGAQLLLTGGFTGTTGLFGGQVTGVATADPQYQASSTVAHPRMYGVATSNVERWEFGGNTDTESGSNAGTNFELRRYADAGTLIDAPLAINRATGIVTILDGLTLPVQLTIANGGTGATTAVNARSNLGVAIGSQVQAWNTYLDCLSTLPPSTGILKFGTVGACSAGAATFADLVGSLGCSQRPAETGDVTAPSGSCATTVASILGVAVAGTTGTVNVAFSASPTFTGTITGANETLSGTFTLTGANPQALLNTAAGVNRSVAYRTGGLDRFQLRVNATAEGGSNAGSDFELRRYNDAGTFVDDPLSIIRATGVVTIADGLTLTVPLAISSGGTGASTAAAARSGLGVAIGSQVQAWNTYLDCLSNLPPATGLLSIGTVGACSTKNIGVDLQAWNTYLDCLSTLPPATGILRFGTVGACSAGNTVSVGEGGTGDTSLTSNAVLYGAGTGAIGTVTVNAGSTHQYLTQFSSGVPVFATIQNSDVAGLGTASIANTGSSGGVLPFLNAANTWSAAQQFGAGSCAAPSVDVGSSNDSGLYQDSSASGDNLGLCAHGTLRALLLNGSSGAPLVFASTAAAAVATSIGGTNNGIENIGNGQFGNWRSLLLGNTTTADKLVLAKSRSTTLGSFSALSSGDQIARIDVAGDDGASYDTLAGDLIWVLKGAPATGSLPTDFLVNLMNSAGALRQVFCLDADTGFWNGVSATGAACGGSGFNFLDRSNNANFATVAISGTTIVDANGNFTGATVAAATQVVSPATGFSQTISANIDTLLLTPSGTLAAGTVKMPAAPLNNQRVTIATSQTITALTLNPNTGQTVNGAPTTLPANTSVTFKYQVATTTWYRLQ